MKRLIVAFLILLLAAGPAMAHYGLGGDASAQEASHSLGMAGHAMQNQNADTCKAECDGEIIAGPCCSFMIAHCETISVRNDLSELLISRQFEQVSFIVSDIHWARLMPEQETPPPRI